MKTIFVSCQSVDSKNPQALIAGLRGRGIEVDHSPSNPINKSDDRWKTWYQIGLPQSIEKSQLFVIVVDEGWDSSTWMGIEADEGTKRQTSKGDEYVVSYWNPKKIPVKGMTWYLKEELPDDVDEAIAALVKLVN